MGDHIGHHRAAGPVESLRNEFRGHLELFYGRLKLAAPYDSVEKAVGTLSASLNTLSPEDLERLSGDTAQRWMHFREAFIKSGLSLKHRGIIAGLARSRQTLDLPPELDHLLDLYTSTR